MLNQIWNNGPDPMRLPLPFFSPARCTRSMGRAVGVGGRLDYSIPPVWGRHVKRAALLLMVVVATVSIGCDGSISAGAATSLHSQFCTSIEPSVKASQQLKPILAGMSSQTVVNTKSHLVTEMVTILHTFRSVEVRLRSAPANVQRSFEWDISADEKVKTGLEKATTKRQISAAVAEIVGSHSKEEAPFIDYVLSQCESRSTSDAPSAE